MMMMNKIMQTIQIAITMKCINCWGMFFLPFSSYECFEFGMKDFFIDGFGFLTNLYTISYLTEMTEGSI